MWNRIADFNYPPSDINKKKTQSIAASGQIVAWNKVARSQILSIKMSGVMSKGKIASWSEWLRWDPGQSFIVIKTVVHNHVEIKCVTTIQCWKRTVQIEPNADTTQQKSRTVARSHQTQEWDSWKSLQNNVQFNTTQAMSGTLTELNISFMCTREDRI